jgi:hypothetical protein
MAAYEPQDITEAVAVPLPYGGCRTVWDAGDYVYYLKWNLLAKTHHANEKRVTSTYGMSEQTSTPVH